MSRRADIEHWTEHDERRRISRIRAALAILSGLMLGLSFPPGTLGVLACAGLVPLLIALSGVERIRTGLWYTYVAMVVFHAITISWTGGYVHGRDQYMMIAGAITILIHPVFYFLPLGAFLFAKKYLGERNAVLSLPAFWVAYEYSHSLSEWSFPWLTLGNSQSHNLAGIQFISVTGIFGLSFWILAVNVALYILYSAVARGSVRPWSVRGALAAAAVLLLYYAPAIHGTFVLGQAGHALRTGETVTVGIVQSNADPWEKWSGSGTATVDLYFRQTDSLLNRRDGCRPAIVLWPETAVPYYLLTPGSATALADVRARIDAMGVSILTGLPHAVEYPDSSQAPPSARRNKRTGERYDSFNAAALIQPGADHIQWYGKMKMVPLAERVPYVDLFHFIDFLRWDVGIGGWQIGRDTTVFVDRASGTKFSTMICYESTYPAFVAEFVRRGAEFIAIITIDSWWGRMPGAFQHQRYSVFRAVENRRWVARCAAGGISCFIDPYGRVYDQTDLFTRTTICREIGRETRQTLYTRAGDWPGQLAMIATALVLAASAGERFLRRRRDQLWNPT